MRADGRWVRAGRCDSGHCVEAAVVGAVVLVRDSKDTATPPLEFTVEAWRAFTVGLRSGRG